MFVKVADVVSEPKEENIGQTITVSWKFSFPPDSLRSG